MKELYAHSANSQGQRHRLGDHLKGTAERAANMAKEFGCSRWGWFTYPPLCAALTALM